MADGGSSANNGEAVTGLAYARAYSVLFAAHWFGARRFDRVDDGFDPEDVQAFHAHKVEYLKRNFLRSKSVRAAAPASAEAAAAAAAAGRPPAQRGAEEGGGAAAAEATEAQAGQADVGQAGEAGAGAAETQVTTSRQVFPKFVFGQCFLMCLLYTMFALKKHAEDGMTGRDPWLAGLDSIKRGSTDLRWTGPECEDYRGQVWRWITYQFTHVGVGHIFANCLLLVVFGTALEGHEGSVRMFLLWNAGVVAGALCWFVGGAHGCVVGSSAGVYSLVGVQFEDLIMNWRERHFHWCALFVLLAYALLDAVTWLWSMDLQKVDYSYSIAVGGGLAGLIIGSFMGRNYVMTRKDKLLISGLSLLGVALTLFALIWLGTHETPVNIWEAGAGEDGWCWVGQFYGRRINATSWQCVRCATKECIEEWTTRRKMAPVSVSACEAQGWYYDER